MAFLNEYEKIKLIGKGSFATIWKVRHLQFGYIRAIKVSNEMVEDENDPAYQSFMNECKVLLQIGNGSHPNIVHIYQPRLVDNRAVVEMDYVEGETIDKYLARVKFISIDEFRRFFEEIVGALAYCHHDIYRFLMDPNVDDLVTDPNDGQKYIIDEATERRLVAKYGVTHNDIHSNNVMRRSYDGNFILLDFGLAIQDGKAVKSSSRRGGALEYMSPEKFEDSSVISPQSDIYSLGVLLYEMLAGRVPFQMDPARFSSNPTAASFEMMNAHKTAIPPAIESLRREAFETANPGQTYVKDFPDWLEDLILRCLEKNPADRFADAKALLDAYKAMNKEQAANNVHFVPRNGSISTPYAHKEPSDTIIAPPPISEQHLHSGNAQPSPTTIIPPPVQDFSTTDNGLQTHPPLPPKQPSGGSQPSSQNSPLRVTPTTKKKSHAGLIVFLILLFLAALGVGGYFGYQWYEDSQYEHYYTYANSLILRSSAVKMKDNSNKIASLPYGTELLMVNHGSTWSEVKAKTADGKQEGFVSSDYILSQSDYFLLDGIFSNQAARDKVNDSKYRDALLKYYKEHNFRGYISDEAYKAMGRERSSDKRQIWQLTGYDTKDNNSIYKTKVFNTQSKYDDLVVVLERFENNKRTDRKLVYFYIDNDGKSYVVYEDDYPDSDRIKSVTISPNWWTGNKDFNVEYY